MSQQLELTPSPNPSRMPKKYIIAGMLAIVLVALVLCILWIYSGRIVTDSGLIRVGLVPISTPMTSTLTEILVLPGEKVQQGQLLARLDGKDYMQQYAAASALVHGSFSLPSPEQNAARLAEIKALEEHLVQQIALARHEEHAARILVEQHSIAHARASLHMRNTAAAHAPAHERKKAVDAELKARQLLEQAQQFFEYTSRGRSAIEGELHNIRNDIAHARRPETAPYAASQHTADNAPHLIYAPVTGTLTDNFPQVGSVVQKDQVLFSISPDRQDSMTATAVLPASAAKSITQGTPCFLIPKDMDETLTGVLDKVVNTSDAARVGLYMTVDARDLKEGEVFQEDIPARVVFWTHPWVQSGLQSGIQSGAGMGMLHPILILLSHF